MSINLGLKDYGLIGLCLLLLVSSLGWYITDLKLDRTREQVKTERALYSRAQEEYTVKALKAKQEQERKDNERAQKADADYSDLLAKYNASLLRYKAAQRASSRTDLSGSPKTTEGSPRPGASPELSDTEIIIPFSDAQICATNTARLEAIHEWATSVR